MKNILSLPAIILLSSWVLSAQPAITDTKKAIIASVEKHRGALIDISDKIWAHAETAFEETQSAKLLADYAEQQGRVQTTQRSCGLCAPYSGWHPTNTCWIIAK